MTELGWIVKAKPLHLTASCCVCRRYIVKSSVVRRERMLFAVKFCFKYDLCVVVSKFSA